MPCFSRISEVGLGNLCFSPLVSEKKNSGSSNQTPVPSSQFDIVDGAQSLSTLIELISLPKVVNGNCIIIITNMQDIASSLVQMVIFFPFQIVIKFCWGWTNSGSSKKNQYVYHTRPYLTSMLFILVNNVHNCWSNFMGNRDDLYF